MKTLTALKSELLSIIKSNQDVLLGDDHQFLSKSIGAGIAEFLSQEQITATVVEVPTSTAMLSYLTKNSDNFEMCIMVGCIDVTDQICVVKVFSKSGILLTDITVNGSELNSESQARKLATSADFSRGMNTYRAHVGIQGLLDPSMPLNRKLPIIIAGMHGVAGSILPWLFKNLGYTGVMFVPEEDQSDGKFTFANPRNSEALADGMRYLRGRKAGMFLAIDPAGERLTVTVREDSGDYRILSSAEVAVLMADFICACRKENGILSKRSVLIDSADGLLAPVAKRYGIQHQVITGDFKEISGQIEKNQHGWFKHPLVMATDGQDGYLTGQYVSYRDALGAAVVMCELYCYYESTPGVGMMEKLAELAE